MSGKGESTTKNDPQVSDLNSFESGGGDIF